jgi:hypothetical protein
MVEWVGVFVSAVGILLQRISDKEKKLDQRIDVKDALMDLLHLVRGWESLAERTNQLLLEWISKEKTEDELLYRKQLQGGGFDSGSISRRHSVPHGPQRGLFCISEANKHPP